MSSHLLSFGYDPLLMNVRTMLLRTTGYAVTETDSCIETIRLICMGRFDLILMCHTVPEDQQKTVVRRAKEFQPGIAVLCLSDNPGVSYSEFCETASNTAPELLLQIEEALEKAKERRAA